MSNGKKKSEAGKNKKLQLAFYWAASCGGCEIAVLDIDEKILDVVAAADILFGLLQWILNTRTSKQ